MKIWLPFIVVLSLSGAGCAALLHQAPILSPSAAAGLADGLSALQTELATQPNVPPALAAAVVDAQKALAADTTGTTWGSLIRGLLTNLYQQIPASAQENPLIWGGLTVLETILSTIGA